MKGGFLPEHFVLDMDTREGATLRRVLTDLCEDDFPLNEYEQELIEAVLTALDPPEKDRNELPLT